MKYSEMNINKLLMFCEFSHKQIQKWFHPLIDMLIFCSNLNIFLSLLREKSNSIMMHLLFSSLISNFGT